MAASEPVLPSALTAASSIDEMSLAVRGPMTRVCLGAFAGMSLWC